MNYASPKTIARIRANLEEARNRYLDFKPNLDVLHDARNLKRLSLEILVIQELLEYIDEGIEPNEFLKRSLQFCANDRSNPEAIKLRAKYTLYLLGLEEND